MVNQKLRGINSKAWWPVAPYQKVGSPDNIIFHVDDINNFQMPGSYFQAFGRIVIGKGTYIAQNVGIITANHNLQNLDLQAEAKPVSIGEKCWIGMNSIILPGVELGPHTIVGAGSVVTKSFVDGHCVIAGNPAKVIRHLS
ncbi:acyltransferase [uncultured Muribaculum sp.]|uniref:acyltransferase n=1 Tax=uncultured Muribaculum sp. TaxID=1918613 RepID=UPI00266F26BA|nr:acyltransferase [uncultured Muribaculum sp.]